VKLIDDKSFSDSKEFFWAPSSLVIYSLNERLSSALNFRKADHTNYVDSHLRTQF